MVFIPFSCVFGKPFDLVIVFVNNADSKYVLVVGKPDCAQSTKTVLYDDALAQSFFGIWAWHVRRSVVYYETKSGIGTNGHYIHIRLDMTSLCAVKELFERRTSHVWRD